MWDKAKPFSMSITEEIAIAVAGFYSMMEVPLRFDPLFNYIKITEMSCTHSVQGGAANRSYAHDATCTFDTGSTANYYVSQLNPLVKNAGLSVTKRGIYLSKSNPRVECNLILRPFDLDLTVQSFIMLEAAAPEEIFTIHILNIQGFAL